MAELHALITEMAAELDRCQQLLKDDRRQRHPLADHARALLAEPVAEGPTNDDFVEALKRLLMWPQPSTEAACEQDYTFARAALARRGHHPAPPGEGEVAEVAAWLRLFCSEEYESRSFDPDVARLTRAAELLEQRYPAPVPVLPDDAQIIEPAEHTLLVPVAQPVPVSERLPGPGDCDAGGCCWAWEEDGDTWGLTPSKWLPKSWGSCTHWLPAHALPTPEATND